MTSLTARLPAATFGGVEFYPDLAPNTAVPAARLINDHPLHDGNKRVGYLCTQEFTTRNSGTWTRPIDDPGGDDRLFAPGSGGWR